jgi:hypothetical protein
MMGRFERGYNDDDGVLMGWRFTGIWLDGARLDFFFTSHDTPHWRTRKAFHAYYKSPTCLYRQPRTPVWNQKQTFIAIKDCFNNTCICSTKIVV